MNKTMVCVTDDLYIKDKAPNICSAGWVIACKQTRKQISGTLVERSESDPDPKLITLFAILICTKP